MSEASQPKDASNNSQTTPPVWDTDRCRAKRSGSPRYDNCLVQYPFCDHAFRFGLAYLCLHPQRTEIVARTEALKNKIPVTSVSNVTEQTPIPINFAIKATNAASTSLQPLR